MGAFVSFSSHSQFLSHSHGEKSGSDLEMCACVCVCAYMRSCVRTCVRVCVCACMRVCMHACVHLWATSDASYLTDTLILL